MKAAKETASSVHSNRTEMENDQTLRNKSIESILGLDVEGTLLRMDNEGLCHIDIAHPDPDYSERVINYLKKLQIQGQQLDWEGETIELTSIRLTQRAHPSMQKVLQINNHLEFPPLLSSTSTPAPEVIIGTSEASASSSDDSSTENEVVNTNDDTNYDGLVDTDSEHSEPTEPVNKSEDTAKDVPIALYPPSPPFNREKHNAVSFGADTNKGMPKDLVSNASSSQDDSLISPTPSSRDSTVVDFDNGNVTVFQKRATAKDLHEQDGVWLNSTKDTAYDEELDDAQRYFSTDEDDVNTISSDKTSHYKNLEEANKEEAPPSKRYQIGFQIDDDDLTTLLQELNRSDDTDTFPDTLSKTRALMISFFNQAKSLDTKFAIISWADASTFEMIRSAKEIPTDTVKFASFFKGFRPRQTTGRMYMRLRLHAPTIGQAALGHGMTEWSRLSGCTFYQTVIQAENASSIGWFVYSAPHSNLNSLMSHMMVKTGYEWGYKLGSCTTTDSLTTDDSTGEQTRTLWKDRIKALFIYVPNEKAMEAKNIMADMMEINASTVTKQIPSLSDKFLFMHPERQMSDEPSKLYYQQILSKQISHNKHLQITMANIFDQPIDQPVLTRNNEYVSLRQMVMSIRVTNPKSDFCGASLFQGLDYSEDSGKIYKNGLPGPGGPAYVFSYYTPMAGEAEEMIQGLGVYVGRVYGNRAVNPCFTTTHWNGNKGWIWQKDVGKFVTPATRQKDANLRFDPNLAIEKLTILDAVISPTVPEPSNLVIPAKKKRSKKRRGKKKSVDKDDDSATCIDPLKTKETSLLRKAMDHDNDSQIQANSGGHVKQKAVSQVTVPPSDAVSIASTLTMGSITDTTLPVPLPYDKESNTSPTPSQLSSVSSLKSVSNPAYFQAMLESGMSPEAIRERADTFYKHQINKAQLGHQRALENFLSNLSDKPPVVTPHKSKHTGSLNTGAES
jgi:hypothetical protein